MREPRPFFRKQTASWYVKLGKEFHPLGGKGQPGKEPPSEVSIKYHALMAGRKPVAPVVAGTIASIVAKFLAWCECQCKSGDMKAGTHRWYKRFLDSFVESIGNSLTIEDLKPRHVAAWRDEKYAGTTIACKRGAIVSVKRALNWAADPEQELIASNPIGKMKSGKPESREVYIKPEQWPAILSAVDDSDPFKQVLLFLKETGCRPGEATIADCRHVDRERKVIVLGINEWKCGKKTGKKRTIYLNEEAFLIVERAYARVGQKGRLFLNRKLQPFSVAWIGKTFASLQEKLRKQFGDDEFELSAYVIRHTYITDKLKQGVDVCTVAKLAGTSAEMVQEVYCQLGLNEDHLHNAAARKVVAS